MFDYKCKTVSHFSTLWYGSSLYSRVGQVFQAKTKMKKCVVVFMCFPLDGVRDLKKKNLRSNSGILNTFLLLNDIFLM